MARGISTWNVLVVGTIAKAAFPAPLPGDINGQGEGLEAAAGHGQARHHIAVIDLLLAEVLVLLDIALGQVGVADGHGLSLGGRELHPVAVQVVIRLDREDHLDPVRRRGDDPDLEGLIRLQRFCCQGSYLLRSPGAAQSKQGDSG